MLAHVFNMGNPARKQCACRADGVWFVRHRRHDAPGFTAWKLAPFTSRPPYAWYDGKKARLPSNGINRQTRAPVEGRETD